MLRNSKMVNFILIIIGLIAIIGVVVISCALLRWMILNPNEMSIQISDILDTANMSEKSWFISMPKSSTQNIGSVTPSILVKSESNRIKTLPLQFSFASSNTVQNFSDSSIPQIVIQYFKSKIISHQMFVSIMSIRTKNQKSSPTMIYYLFDETSAYKFMKEHENDLPNQVIKSFYTSNSESHKVQLFKFSSIYIMGGFWINPEANPTTRNAELFTKRKTLEYVAKDADCLLTLTTSNKLCDDFIGASPKNPQILKFLNLIAMNQPINTIIPKSKYLRLAKDPKNFDRMTFFIEQSNKSVLQYTYDHC